MGQPVEVVVSELHSAATRLADAAQHLRDGLASVDDETSQLLSSGWRGEAASAYTTAWDRWNDGAKKVVEGLQRMSELLDVAGREYGRTDQSAAEGLGATMQGAGGPSSGGGSASGAEGDSGAGPPGDATPSPAAGAATAGSSGIAEGLGQALSTAAQLPQAALQPLGQAGQTAGGIAQLVTQMALGLAPRAEDAVDSPPGATQATEGGDPHDHLVETRSAESTDGAEMKPDDGGDDADPGDEGSDGANGADDDGVDLDEATGFVDRSGD